MKPDGGPSQVPVMARLSWQTLAAAAVITCLVGAALFYGLETYMLRQAERNIQSVLLAHKGIHHYIQRNTHPALYQLKKDGEVPEDFYSPELLSSSFMLRNIHAYSNEERAKAGLPPIYYKMAAKNPRNPINQADELETRLIDMFNRDRGLTHYDEIIEIDGQRYLYYAVPFLSNNQACLKCHGPRGESPRQLQDRYPGEGGFNESVDEIRAIEFVRAPLRSHFQSFHLIFATLLAGVAALVLLMLFNHRLGWVVRERTAELEKELAERKRAENALRERRDFLRTLVESSLDAIVTTDGERNITSCNPAFLAMYGYHAEEVVGRPVRLLHLSEQSYAAWSSDILPQVARRGFWRGEWEFARKNGAPLAAEVVISAHRGHGGDIYGYVAIHRDITARKQAEETKARLEAQLLQAQKMEAIGTLAGGIAHDFNNILAAIIGYSEIALADAQAGRAKPADIAQILGSAERAKQLVKQILAFSRKGAPDLKVLDVNKVVGSTLAILERTLPKMIAIEAKLASQLPPVQADPVQLEQVLLNLASNAADAMPEGGRLSIGSEMVELDDEYCRQHLEVRPGGYALLTISDTGQGMDRTTCGHIFEPFFTTKEVGKGTGLGLSTAFGIVKSHGGHIHCYSEPGLGAIFKVYLPLYGETKPAPPEEAGQAADASPRGSESILLVDDEESLLRVGSANLQGMGYRVLSARSGEEALKIYQEKAGQLDLVIMDLGMPGMGGHKALKSILEMNPQAKVLIASGYAANAQVKAALEAGAAGYVAKPYKRAELLAMVRAVLDGK